jgi:hypothetical protein
MDVTCLRCIYPVHGSRPLHTSLCEKQYILLFSLWLVKIWWINSLLFDLGLMGEMDPFVGESGCQASRTLFTGQSCVNVPFCTAILSLK